MTIAIPAAGPGLDEPAEVAVPHAPFILFVDATGEGFEAVPNPAARAAAHPGAVVAKLLLDRGVTAVLGHHMGPHPAAALARNRVAVHEGRPGVTARQLLALYREGALPVLDEAEVNRRHGPGHGGHGHGGHHHG